MKFSPTEFIYNMQRRTSQRNFRLLARFLVLLIAVVILYSALFQFFMTIEGQEHSWLTGVYWTLTAMSTLGFGDITFKTDLGRGFSILVLLSGLIFLLILFPFIFIQFFQSEARVSRELPPDISGHVVLTHYDAITRSLIARLTKYRYAYVLIVEDLQKALHLHDSGINVVLGALDNPETYRRIRVQNAAMVAATASDTLNVNIAFTVREVSTSVPIVAMANLPASKDILKMAECSRVLRLDEMMGKSLARRTIWGDAVTHVIGEFDRLLIAEATAAGTPLVGKTIRESKLREAVGITVVGVWERGRFETAGPDTIISLNTVLVLAGSPSQLQRYDEFFCIYHVAGAPVIIVGGGRIGRATGEALAARKIDYRIIERLPERIADPDKYILGDAAQPEVLQKAGIKDTPTVIISTHDDNTNIYLTIYCRRLRKDIQIISRATSERNVQTLHKAGADFVMSSASMGANTIFNLLERSDILILAEGLDVFRVPLPPSLAGQTIAESAIRPNTGCSVIAVNTNNTMQINSDPTLSLPDDSEIILIGSVEAENEFLKLYGNVP